MTRSELVGYIRKSENSNVLKLNLLKSSLDTAKTVDSKDGTEYVSLIMNLAKIRMIVGDEHDVTAVCQLIDENGELSIKDDERPVLALEKIIIERIREETPDLSYLGEFGKAYKLGAIEHDPGDSLSYNYFYPCNHVPHDPNNWDHVSEKDKKEVIAKHGSLENADKQYAQEDYERMLAYGKGDWCSTGIQATAIISMTKDGNPLLSSEMKSAGVYGVESDMDSDDPHAIELIGDEISNLTQSLHDLGFKDEYINSVPREIQDELELW